MDAWKQRDSYGRSDIQLQRFSVDCLACCKYFTCAAVCNLDDRSRFLFVWDISTISSHGDLRSLNEVNRLVCAFSVVLFDSARS